MSGGGGDGRGGGTELTSSDSTRELHKRVDGFGDGAGKGEADEEGQESKNERQGEDDALHGGDDYELLFTASAEPAALGLPLYRIGTVAAQAGIRYVVQPGGSKRDEEVIATCDQLGVAMALTGMRHFRH